MDIILALARGRRDPATYDERRRVRWRRRWLKNSRPAGAVSAQNDVRAAVKSLALVNRYLVGHAPSVAAALDLSDDDFIEWRRGFWAALGLLWRGLIWEGRLW